MMILLSFPVKSVSTERDFTMNERFHRFVKAFHSRLWPDTSANLHQTLGSTACFRLLNERALVKSTCPLGIPRSALHSFWLSISAIYID